jgi:hypothetical protein
MWITWSNIAWKLERLERLFYNARMKGVLLHQMERP